MQYKTVVEVKDLVKIFRLPRERHYSLKQTLLNFHRNNYELFSVLNGISFDVFQGEFLGIIGRNGCGKSTLLKTIGGIYLPTKGSVILKESLTSFIELGIGFNTELTGRDNVYLNGAILGLSRKEIDYFYKEIIEYADLIPFMDQKLKNFSSGMQVRLAFSIAIRAHRNILLIDEVLAVGDANFRKKCLDYFKSLNSKQTVILVTHDMEIIKELCDRAILINKGLIVAQGKPHFVAQEYDKLN